LQSASSHCLQRINAEIIQNFLTLHNIKNIVCCLCFAVHASILRMTTSSLSKKICLSILITILTGCINTSSKTMAHTEMSSNASDEQNANHGHNWVAYEKSANLLHEDYSPAPEIEGSKPSLPNPSGVAFAAAIASARCQQQQGSGYMNCVAQEMKNIPFNPSLHN